MGKYIWPRNIADASYWYLQVLKELQKGTNLNELIDKIGNDKFGKRPTRRSVQHRLYSLERSGYIEKQGKYNKSSYRISQKGIERLERLTFEDYKSTLSQKWDGHWRLVMYDIPESLKDARYHIRRLLKELGFQQLQLSVWIHPLPYLEAFREIQRAYGIESDVLLLEVVNYQPPTELLKRFKKLYPNLL